MRFIARIMWQFINDLLKCRKRSREVVHKMPLAIQKSNLMLYTKLKHLFIPFYLPFSRTLPRIADTSCVGAKPRSQAGTLVVTLMSLHVVAPNRPFENGLGRSANHEHSS